MEKYNLIFFLYFGAVSSANRVFLEVQKSYFFNLQIFSYGLDWLWGLRCEDSERGECKQEAFGRTSFFLFKIIFPRSCFQEGKKHLKALEYQKEMQQLAKRSVFVKWPEVDNSITPELVTEIFGQVIFIDLYFYLNTG